VRNSQFEVHSFEQANPDIHNSQTGNRSTEIIAQDKITKQRGVTKKEVILPVLRPGEDDEEEPKLKAEKDEDDNQNLTDH
jgi:hypothetical protein